MKPRSLRGRVFVATLTASLLAVGLALLIGILATRSAARDSARKEVEREAAGLAARLPSFADRLGAAGDASGLGQLADSAATPPPGQRDPRENLQGPSGPGDQRGATSRLPNGLPPRGPGGDRAASPLPRVLRVADATSLLPPDAAAAVVAGRGASGSARINGRRSLFAAVPVAGDDVFVLATRADTAQAGNFSRYATGLIAAALAAAVLSALAAAGLARRLTRPIADVVAASGALAAGRTPDRVDEPETEELAELARTFNAMADQLARAREAERTVLMSASHELRTPLTAISGYAEGIEDGTIEPRQGAAVIGSEAGRLERLVQDLLALARIDQGTFETRNETVDLAQVALTARDRLALRARDDGVDLVVETTPGASATADSGRVLQIVSNLVDNAVRVTPRGGRVEIAVAPGQITVTDTGPGFLDEDLPHVFERFHMRRLRGSGSPDGSGIGLAIVRELTQAMTGTVSVQNVPGAGARFTVSLPR